MFTDPQIYSPESPGKRAFISFYYDGKRFRYYNGKVLGLECYPNNSHNAVSRDRLLKQLSKAFTKALYTGWKPEEEVTKIEKYPMVRCFDILKTDIIGSSYSKDYQRDIEKILNGFSEFLVKERGQDVLIDQILTADVERFLQRFTSSGTYYQNKRRTLSAVFSKLVKRGYCKVNPVVESSKRKSKAVLHEAYKPDQLVQVLSFLQIQYPNLYLCSLLMYGTLLRPHKEIRLLKRRHFDETFSTFSLDGNENKSGRIRSLPVPEFVQVELLERNVDILSPEENIFTRTIYPFNESYFNTMWSRAKEKMLQTGLIQSRQTLYSFRHSASVNVFTRTQNLKLLQQLLGHSNLNTSMTYLRSIGAVQVESTMMPEL